MPAKITTQTRWRLTGVGAALTALLLLGGSTTAHAGCGCDKPPPPPSQLLPHVAFAGTPVRFLNPAFVVGRSYDVTFTSGTSAASATVQGQVVARRDLADTVVKPQLVVPLPTLPLGPAGISIADSATGVVVAQIDDAQFTVAPTPISLPAAYGTGTYPGFQAAVGRDGVAYIGLDLTGMEMPMVFEAQAKGYPLRFGGDDVVFYNVQGFLMQRIEVNTQPVPGMFAFPAPAGSLDSDILHYSRHEFVTYFLQHAEHLPHSVDPTDPNWHLDGSRHVDHDHLILAIMGLVNGATPKPGATQPFDLALTTSSLFHEGLVGTKAVKVTNTAVVDSYQPGAFGFGDSGDVFSGGSATVSSGAEVNGSVTGASLNVASNAVVSGGTFVLLSSPSFMAIKMPPGIANLGDIKLQGQAMRLYGPASFAVSSISLQNNSLLTVDNTAGPVTLYVTGVVSVDNSSSIVALNPNPEEFAIYVSGGKAVTITGRTATAFYGVLYAPDSPVTIANGSEFYGAFVGGNVTGSGTIHYDSSLRSLNATTVTAPAPGFGSKVFSGKISR
jgi:hypothetical protein